jgi:hypothetical protein
MKAPQLETDKNLRKKRKCVQAIAVAHTAARILVRSLQLVSSGSSSSKSADMHVQLHKDYFLFVMDL